MNAHIFLFFFSPCCSIDGVDNLINLMQDFSCFLPSSNHLLLSHVHCLSRCLDSTKGIILFLWIIQYKSFSWRILSEKLKNFSSPAEIQTAELLRRKPMLWPLCRRAQLRSSVTGLLAQPVSLKGKVTSSRPRANSNHFSLLRSII